MSLSIEKVEVMDLDVKSPWISEVCFTADMDDSEVYNIDVAGTFWA